MKRSGLTSSTQVVCVSVLVHTSHLLQPHHVGLNSTLRLFISHNCADAHVNAQITAEPLNSTCAPAVANEHVRRFARIALQPTCRRWFLLQPGNFLSSTNKSAEQKMYQLSKYCTGQLDPYLNPLTRLTETLRPPITKIVHLKQAG